VKEKRRVEETSERDKCERRVKEKRRVKETRERESVLETSEREENARKRKR